MSEQPCGCCEGDELLVPATLDNRAGLSALAYRVGTHARFKRTMLALLSRQAALNSLTTRSDDDPAVALIDAWSAVLDVLTFYQERILNEGYLRTASESLSLKALARTISYTPNPGVAAETFLAFDVEAPTVGSAGTASIPVGTRVQSIPFPGEVPQIFETTEDLNAGSAWNRLPVKRYGAQTLDASTQEVYLHGQTTQLQKGDALLFVSEDRHVNPDSLRWALRFVSDVQTDRDMDWTRVTLDQALGDEEPTLNSDDAPTIYALRQRAAIFAHNPPDFLALAADTQAAYRTLYGDTAMTDFPDDALSATIDMDAVYARVTAGGWVALVTEAFDEMDNLVTFARLYKAERVTNPSLTKNTVSAKVTRVTPDTETDLGMFTRRTTSVFAQSEPLTLADVPLTTTISGTTLTLASEVAGLYPGQRILIAGVTDLDEETGEAALIESAFGTEITLQDPLTHAYDVQTATVYGNAAPATHGETKIEILGSGSGALAFQKFELKNKRLTFVPSADDPSGAETTLTVRVNAVLWEETPTLFGRMERDRVYVTHTADDGTVTVQFGDGIEGARLPTGVENVSATYRVGIGLAGLLQPHQLSLLMTRPLGVRAVTNPVAPINAADPEDGDNVRDNAPLTVLTFERVVSLKDYEAFARAYAGVAKASALAMRPPTADGERQVVYLTVAGVNNTVIDTANPLRERLRTALITAGAKVGAFELLAHTPLTFGLSARVVLQPGYLEEDVTVRLSDALSETFAFERRGLGQSVTYSEAAAIMHGVEGVQGVALDDLFIVETFFSSDERLPAYGIRRVGSSVLAAELLTIDMDQVSVTIVPGLTS
jgi:predicted phage baseplate assembly protein